MTETAQWISVADYEAALWRFLQLRSRWTPEGVQSFLLEFGPMGAPISMYYMAHAPGFPLKLLRPHAGRAWISARRPTLVMKWEAWKALYRRIGYTVDGAAAPRPTRPVRMWRGAHRNYRINQSWTTDRGLAAAFAQGPGRGLWTALVEPDRMLATLAEAEPQTIVDTDGLTVQAEPLTAADRQVVSFHQRRQAYWNELAENLPAEDRVQIQAFMRVFEPWEDLTE